MKISQPHSWSLSVPEAVALQKDLSGKVVRDDRLGPVRHVGGVDVGFEDGGRIARAAVVVLRLADLSLMTWAIARREVTFPYVPGLLSFREMPAVLDALERLEAAPDLLLCDGQGLAHPRRFGIACHLGLTAGLPSIGVAKSRLVGTHDEPGPGRGDLAPLVDRGEVIGAVLRTRIRVKPVYVSIGHRVSLEAAIDYVMRCTTRYRLPEPTRLADKLSRSDKPPLI